MANLIDYDRGVHIRTVDSMGLDVFMYVDSPGVYLNAHGKEVSIELAKAAGFPVETHVKQRQIKERMATAIDQIKREMEAVPEEKRVILERKGFTMIDIGLDRYQVLAPDGDVLTKNPMSKREAEIVFSQLVPEDENDTDNGPPGGAGDSKPPRGDRKSA